MKTLATAPRLLASLLFSTRVIPTFQKVFFFLLSAPFVNTSSKQDLKLLHGDPCAPGRVTANSPAPGGDEGPLQWARDAQTGMTGKGQQTHLHRQPVEQGGDGHAPGLTCTSSTGDEHLPPASARRPSMLTAVNQPVWTDTLAGTRSSSAPRPGEQKHLGEPSSELNTY